MNIEIPEAIYNLNPYFRSLFDKEPYDLKSMMSRVASQISQDKRHIIIKFVDQLLSSNYTEQQMNDFWSRLDSGIYIEKEGGVKYFLTEFRKYLI